MRSDFGKRLGQILGSVLLLLGAVSAAGAETLEGRVVAISDGDTFTLLTPDKEQVKVRLAEIDTPERRQPYGTRSRQALADLVFGQPVRVQSAERDRYGRVVGRVYLKSRPDSPACLGLNCPDPDDVNAQLVYEGAAWVYKRYHKDPKLLVLEEEAQEARRGLWALPESQRVPPWEWRRTERDRRAEQRRRPAAAWTGEVHCGSKRYCREMIACAEARAYLQQCHVTTLDGDGDGVPCERLCGN